VHFDQEGLRLSFLILMKNAVLWIFIPSRQEGDSSFQLFFLEMDEITLKNWRNQKVIFVKLLLMPFAKTHSRGSLENCHLF
jgi:hypothetical protein